MWRWQPHWMRDKKISTFKRYRHTDKNGIYFLFSFWHSSYVACSFAHYLLMHERNSYTMAKSLSKLFSYLNLFRFVLFSAWHFKLEVFGCMGVCAWLLVFFFCFLSFSHHFVDNILSILLDVYELALLAFFSSSTLWMIRAPFRNIHT